MRQIPLYLHLAARNLLLRRGPTLLIGGLLAVSAALAVLGGALIEAMDAGIERSVTESLAGDLQIYSAAAPDPLSLYGDQLLGTPDYGVIPDFSAALAALEGLEEVAGVTPLGTLMAMVKPETAFERALGDLRRDWDKPERRAALLEQLRGQVEALSSEIGAAARVAEARGVTAARVRALEAAAQPPFWAQLEARREASLALLEEEVAPLFTQGQQVALFCLGTDLQRFAEQFGRFKIRRGRSIPPGAQGILLNERVYAAALEDHVAVGDALTLNSQTRAGYTRSRRLTVYGTFEFEGLDGAQIAQAYHLIDLHSFRHLYGFAEAVTEADMNAMQQRAGVQDLQADEVEAALFGGAPPSSAPPPPPKRASPPPDPVIHAAITLAPGVDAEIGRQRVADALDEAGLNLKVIDWREATGLIGQTVVMIRGVLLALMLTLAVFILVVINHSVSLATFERRREIGAMRAIGASRGFVLALTLTEGLILSLVGGGLGALVGSLAVWALSALGLPAGNAFMAFLFSGEALYPVLSWGYVLMAVLYVGLITLLSHLPPARMAASTPPAVAMGGGR